QGHGGEKRAEGVYGKRQEKRGRREGQERNTRERVKGEKQREQRVEQRVRDKGAGLGAPQTHARARQTAGTARLSRVPRGARRFFCARRRAALNIPQFLASADLFLEQIYGIAIMSDHESRVRGGRIGDRGRSRQLRYTARVLSHASKAAL